MSEPQATEADALEQQQPVLDPDQGLEDETVAGAAAAETGATVPLDANEADRAEQETPVPLDEDDYR